MKSSSTHNEPATDPAAAYEKRDADSVRLLVIGFGLLALIAVVLAIIWGLYRFMGSRPAVPPGQVSSLAPAQVIPPEPRLQTNEMMDLEQMRRRDDSVLTTYGWVDQKAGIARIPVDTALELMSHSQWPVRPSLVTEKKESSR
jgi:hypothetical protein